MSRKIPMSRTPVSALLDQSIGLPFDVVFQVFDRNSENMYSEVEAHKLIISLQSPVFRSQFFGDFGSPDVVKIENTTIPAFQMLIFHIYGANEDWSKISLEDVFFIADLAEKYFQYGLIENVLKYLDSLVIKEDNVMEAFMIATTFNILHEASTYLQRKCAIYLKTMLDSNPNYALTLAVKYENDIDLGNWVRKLLGSVDRFMCPNCDGILGQCKNSKDVLDKGELKLGTRLVTTESEGIFGNLKKTVVVTDLDVEDEEDEGVTFPQIAVEFDNEEGLPDGIWKGLVWYVRGIPFSSSLTDTVNFKFYCAPSSEYEGTE